MSTDFLVDIWPLHHIRAAFVFSGDVSTGVLVGFDNVASDIKRIARRFRDGQAVVESNTRRDCTKPDDDAPHLVNGKLAGT